MKKMESDGMAACKESKSALYKKHTRWRTLPLGTSVDLDNQRSRLPTLGESQRERELEWHDNTALCSGK